MQIIIKKRTILYAFIIIVGLAIVLASFLEGVKKKEGNNEIEELPSAVIAEGYTGETTGYSAAEDEDFAGGDGAAFQGVYEDTNFFVEYGIERNRVRGQRIEYLREIINNPGSGADSRAQAQEILLGITKTMEKEMELENLIKARGFSDVAVCFLEEVATVILDTGGVQEIDQQGIMEMVARGAGLKVANIDIILRHN